MEKDNFSNQWLKLINDNTELRFMINGQVISKDINYFDNDILQRLEKLGKSKYTYISCWFNGKSYYTFCKICWFYLYLFDK